MPKLTTTDRNPVIEFQMRVFRFRDETEPSHTKQEQDIVCELYLEEKESTYKDKQCNCYTSEECSKLSGPISTSTHTPESTLASLQASSPASTTTSNEASTIAGEPTRTTAATDTTQTLKLTGAVTTAYDFSDELKNQESDVFKEYASTIESEMGSIIMQSSMMQSLQLDVTGFVPVQAARKKRQAVRNVKAMAEFEALAQVPETVEIEDVQTAVEKEIQSASDEGFESLDASSFNTIGIAVATTQISTITSNSASSTNAITTTTTKATTKTTTTTTTTTKATTNTDKATSKATSTATTTATTTSTTTTTTKATTKATTTAAMPAKTPATWDGKLDSVELVNIRTVKVGSSNAWIREDKREDKLGPIVQNPNYIEREPITSFCTGTRMNGFIITSKQCCTALREDMQYIGDYSLRPPVKIEKIDNQVDQNELKLYNGALQFDDIDVLYDFESSSWGGHHMYYEQSREGRFTGSTCILKDSPSVTFEPVVIDSFQFEGKTHNEYAFRDLENLITNKFDIDDFDERLNSIPDEFESCTILGRV